MRDAVSRAPRGLLGRVLLITLITAVYYVAGVVGLELALVRGQVSPIWPATGVALFFLLRFGLVATPGIAVGAILVNLPLGPSAAAVAIITAGNTLAPVTACLLLRRAGFQPALRRLTDAIALVGLGGFASMAISATCGTVALLTADAIDPAAFWPTWLVWWAGDTMGVLIVAPVLLLVYTQRPAWLRSPVRWAEVAALTAGTIAVAVAITSTTIGIFFLAFIPLTWAAVRFQQLAAAPCTLLISVAVTLAATDREGPFSGHAVTEDIVVLHLLNGTLALVTLLLSATINQRNLAIASVEQTCRTLADTVGMLAAATTLSSRSYLRAQAGARNPAPDPDS